MGGGNRNLTPKRRRKKLTEQEKRTKMETKILKVVQQGEAFAVQSQKAESGQTMKCNIVLQEMGGTLCGRHLRLLPHQRAGRLQKGAGESGVLRRAWLRARLMARSRSSSCCVSGRTEGDVSLALCSNRLRRCTSSL